MENIILSTITPGFKTTEFYCPSKSDSILMLNTSMPTTNPIANAFL